MTVFQYQPRVTRVMFSRQHINLAIQTNGYLQQGIITVQDKPIDIFSIVLQFFIANQKISSVDNKAKIKYRIALTCLFFCGECADLIPFSTYIMCKKKHFSRIERFGFFYFVSSTSNLGPPRSNSLQNGALCSFWLSRRKIEPATSNKMASHLIHNYEHNRSERHVFD